MGGTRTHSKPTPNAESPQNNDSRGSAGGSAPEVGGCKTDFLEAVRFIQSLPLTDDEKAQAVRRLLDGQAG